MKNFALVVVVISVIISPCYAAVSNLTADSLGLSSGNYGLSLTLDDFLQLTAMTHTGQPNGPAAGNVYLANGDKGFGVLAAGGNGQNGINGNGRDYAESLVLDFIHGVSASAIQLGLSNYSQSADELVMDLVFANHNALSISNSHANWASALSSTGSNRYMVDIATLAGGASNEIVEHLSVTVFSGQVYVNSVGDSLVPEPATLALLGLGWLVVSGSSLVQRNKKIK